MNLSINGQQLNVQGIRALKPGITIEQAAGKTKNNGYDEVFFSSNGRAYVAYADSLNLGALNKNSIPAVMFNNQQADILAFDDEANSIWEGAAKGAVDEVKNGMDAVRGAVKSIITTVQPTVAVAGGVGIAGLGVYQIWRASQGAATASLGAAASSGGAGLIGDALRSTLVNGIKYVAISGAVGTALLGAYGAVKGALDVTQRNKDMSSIASITEDGSSPVNGGEALGWSELYPAGSRINTPEGEKIAVPGHRYGNLPGYGLPAFNEGQQQYPSYMMPIPYGRGARPSYGQGPSTPLPPQPTGVTSTPNGGLMTPAQLRGYLR